MAEQFDIDGEMRYFVTECGARNGFSGIILAHFDDFVSRRGDLHDEFTAWSLAEGVDVEEEEDESVVCGAMLAFGEKLIGEFCERNNPTIYDAAGKAIVYGPAPPPRTAPADKVSGGGPSLLEGVALGKSAGDDTQEGKGEGSLLEDVARQLGVDPTSSDEEISTNEAFGKSAGATTSGHEVGTRATLERNTTLHAAIAGWAADRRGIGVGGKQVLRDDVDVAAGVGSLGVQMPETTRQLAHGLRAWLLRNGRYSGRLKQYVNHVAKGRFHPRPEVLLCALLCTARDEELTDAAIAVCADMVNNEFECVPGTGWRLRANEYVFGVMGKMEGPGAGASGRTKIRGLSGLTIHLRGSGGGPVARYFSGGASLPAAVLDSWRVMHKYGVDAMRVRDKTFLQKPQVKPDPWGSWQWLFKCDWRGTARSVLGHSPAIQDLVSFDKAARAQRVYLELVTSRGSGGCTLAASSVPTAVWRELEDTVRWGGGDFALHS